jgi:hypothetical protein
MSPNLERAIADARWHFQNARRLHEERGMDAPRAGAGAEMEKHLSRQSVNRAYAVLVRLEAFGDMVDRLEELANAAPLPGMEGGSHEPA